MNKTAQSIAAELVTLETRRAELSSNVEAARADLEMHRAGLVEGSSDIGELTSTQSKHVALVEALAALDVRMAAVRVALSSASEKEKRAETSKRLRQIEQEKEQAKADFYAAQDSVNRMLIEAIAKVNEAKRRWNLLTSEAQGLGQFTLQRIPSREIQPFGYVIALASDQAARIEERAKEKAREQERTERQRQRAA